MRTITLSRTQIGFTLVELLVVIAIVAILASLFLPALSKAKEKARSTQCLSNVRQLSLGLLEFVEEHDEYPLDGIFTRGRLLWQRAVSVELTGDSLRAYSEFTKGVFNCPSVRGPGDRQFFDYGYNSFGLGNENSSLGLSGGKNEDREDGIHAITTGEVVNPSGMIALGDGFVGSKNGIGDGSSRLYRAVGSVFGKVSDHTPPIERHNGRANIGFCDGHVEPLSLKILFDDESDGSLRLWNRDNKPHRERTVL